MSKHRVLVVGVGSIGERHVRCFGATGRVEPSLVETNNELRRAVADRYGVSRAYANLDEALSERRDPCDAAVIATPAQLHVAMAMRVIQAGMHVLIEKPLSAALDGTRALFDLVAERGISAAVAYTYRSHPALRSMKQAIAEGRFGRPVQIVSVWGQHFPKYRPGYRQIYYASRATGGGAIQDVLTHAINAGEFLVGPVDRVMADAAHQVLEGVEVEDTVHALTRHGSVLGCYSLNQHQAPNENSITVICERGTARFELHNSRWLSMAEPGGVWQEEFAFSTERDDVFINQANLFLDAVEGKGAIACTLEEGLQTLRVNLAVLAAVAEPGWVSVRQPEI
jgi:predicted dehydrogenase